MKTLIAFRYSDEDFEIIKPILKTVKKALTLNNIDAYCTFFSKDRDNNLKKPKDWMTHAFQIIDTCDFLFVVQHSSEKSEGMLMEVGYSIAKDRPVIVAVKDNIKGSYLSEMADYSFKWQNLTELEQNINKLGYGSIKSNT